MKIKTLIVDDSVIYRSQIRQALSESPHIEIIGASSNGRLALEKLAQTPADLMILDLEMPELNGIETLRELKKFSQRPKVIVFSSLTSDGAHSTFEALRLGASDYALKPSSQDDASKAPHLKIKDLIEGKIYSLFPTFIASQIPLDTPKNQIQCNQYSRINWHSFSPKIVVIGASTGGPAALEAIFEKLSSKICAPILVTQHMPPVFTTSFAERLSRVSEIKVIESQGNEELIPGMAYLAPGNFHLSLSSTFGLVKTKLDQNPPLNSVRPAVDPLFETAAQIYKEQCLGVVLTGMGQDGMLGCQMIKENGGGVLIQDEASSVVFGMPGAVKSVNAYDKICTLDEIATHINQKCKALNLQAS